MKMPKPDSQTIDKRREIIDALSLILPGEGLIVDEQELHAYECDGLMAYRQLPLVVALPETTEQISQILSYCNNANVKVVPRGAGTGLSGGALPLADGITIGLGKFNRIIDVDFENRAVVAQPGVTNKAIT
ncbi:MAG: FAD-binding protein, partial [Rhodospirillaceae bacterium]|nr:FAD-binding protein [Rhodospirillaceae bacterium]